MTVLTYVDVAAAILPLGTQGEEITWGATSINGRITGRDVTSIVRGDVNQAGFALSDRPLSGKVYFEGQVRSGAGGEASSGIGVATYAGGALPTHGIGTLATELDMGAYEPGWFAYANGVAVVPNTLPAPTVSPFTYRFGFCVDVATRRVWARLIHAGGAEPWPFGGDPVAGTGPTFVVPGTAPIYIAGSARGGGALYYTRIAAVADYLGAPPAGFTHAPLAERIAITGGLSDGSVGAPAAGGFGVTGPLAATVYSVTGAVPPGVTISADGVPTGSFTTAGSFTYILQAYQPVTGKLVQRAFTTVVS